MPKNRWNFFSPYNKIVPDRDFPRPAFFSLQNSVPETYGSSHSLEICAHTERDRSVFLGLSADQCLDGKGAGWNGAYVVSNYDEVAYSSYVNALINDRPRKTDPFIGKDNIEGETLYSIQAVPAFATAYMAKLFGLSASSAFIILNYSDRDLLDGRNFLSYSRGDRRRPCRGRRRPCGAVPWDGRGISGRATAHDIGKLSV